MRLTLAVNIGTEDNRTLNLEKTLAGETVEVTDKVADILLKRGWATAAPAPHVAAPVIAPAAPADPAILKADPPKPEIQTAPNLATPPKGKV